MSEIAYTVTPFDIVADADLDRIIADGMAQISLREQQALILRHWDCMTFRQMGATMKSGTSYARQIYCRAKRRLRQAVGCAVLAEAWGKVTYI